MYARLLATLLAVVLITGCGQNDVDHTDHSPTQDGAATDHAAGAMDHGDAMQGGAGMDHADHEHASSDAPAFATGDALATGGTLYTCAMHPNVVVGEPGRCPICGMDLTPIDPMGEDGVVQIDPGTVQTIGVRTAIVEVAPMVRTVRTTGRFEMDEKGAHTVSLKAGGWVERLHVNFEGAIVRAGQPLLDLYSPVLVTTQEELLLARKNLERIRMAGDERGLADAERLVEAARRRLEYFDVSAEQIRAIETSGTPLRTISYPVPASGEVMEKMVVEGQRIASGDPLMRVFDTTRIWVLADVFEQDLPWVRVGTPANIRVPYVPDQSFEGRVDYLYYMVDRDSRTAQARITLQRTRQVLRPGMYAVVELEGEPTAPTPVVPEEAVVWTGSRSLVILDIGSGRFRPIPVEVGLQAGGEVQITQGLSGGERVVTSAQFLIDSEGRLKSAVSAMVGSHQHGN